MKKIVALFISLIALAFVLPASAATAQKAPLPPDKSIATAPLTVTRFIVAAKTDKAKPAAKPSAVVKKVQEFLATDTELVPVEKVAKAKKKAKSGKKAKGDVKKKT